MELQLMKLRKKAGYKNRDQIADAVASDARREASMSERDLMLYEIWRAKELSRLTGRKDSA